jgi:hypothetical protein
VTIKFQKETKQNQKNLDSTTQDTIQMPLVTLTAVPGETGQVLSWLVLMPEWEVRREDNSVC